jgi:hypothetical protein
MARRGIASVMARWISESSPRKVTLERREIGARHGRRCRRQNGGSRLWASRRHRGAAWRRLLLRGQVIGFTLASGRFRNRKIKRGRTERRRRAIELVGRALGHFRLYTGRLAARARTRNLRKPRVKARNGIVQPPGDRWFVAQEFTARRIVSRYCLRNPLDLPRDRVQALMNVRDVMALLGRHGRPLIVGGAKIGGIEIAERGIQPFIQRHAGPAGGGFGPFPDGRIDAFITPRYARIHGLVRFESGALLAPSASPRDPE